MRLEPTRRHPLDVGALLAATVLAACAALGLLPDRTALGADLAWVWPAACAAIAAAWFASLVARGRTAADSDGDDADGHDPASHGVGPSGLA